MPETIYSFLCEIRLLPWKDLSHWFCSVQGWETDGGWYLQRLAPPPTQSARQAVGPASTELVIGYHVPGLNHPLAVDRKSYDFFHLGSRLMAPPSTFPLPVSEHQQVPASGLASCHFVFTGPKASQTSDSCSSLPQKTELLCPAPSFFILKKIWFYLLWSSLLLLFLSTNREFPFNYSAR